MDRVHSRPKWSIADLNAAFSMLILACLVAVVCFEADRLVYVLGIPPDHIASFWPATAFLVSVLLLVPRRIWPVLVVAGLAAMAIADLKNGVPIGFEIWITLGNLAETLVATLGISRLLNGVPVLSNLKNLAKYLVFAVILVPFASALVGANGSAPGGYWLQARHWFFADALAFLTVAPAILNWVSEGREWWRKLHNYLEFAALMTLLVLFGYFTFMGTGRGERPALLYSLVPLLLWAAFRLGLKGVSTSMIVVALLSIWGAARGHGPFAEQGPLNNALSLQLFLFFAAIPFTILAVLVETQKRAEDALRGSDERFRLAAQAGKMFAYEWDIATDVVVRSGESAQILGIDEARPITGQQLMANVHPDDRERVMTAIAELSPQKPNIQISYRSVRPDGTVIWVETNGREHFDEQGRMVGLVGMTADITERKLAEEALSKVGGRLIEAHEAERTWIARELHDDMGQRLALLANNLQLMEQDPPDSIAEVRNSIHEHLKLVNEVAADLQALSHGLHSSKLQLLGIVAAAKSFCRELSEQHNVEIEFTHADVPPAVPVEDSVCLFRVMQEALQNAVKHSGVQHFEVELRGGSDGIHLIVRDAGVGFDPEVVVNSRGLGLISMQERVNLVNGTFSIDSRPDRGTAIDVRLPLRTRRESARAAGE